MKNSSKVRKQKSKAIAMISVLIFAGFSATLAFAEVSSPSDGGKEKQLVDINNSLKNVIEENQRLLKNNQEISSELNKLKTDHMLEQSKYNALNREHENLASSVNSLRRENNKYSQEVKRLSEDLVDLEGRQQEGIVQAEQMKVELMNQQEVEQEAMMLASADPSTVDENVLNQEAKTLDLLSKIDAFNEADEQLRDDSAKAHYNMGNIYFQKGEYELAAREYYQAVTLMPDDPDAHYNLAFISGEYLKDFETSLKHYKMYLYLNPHPEDEDFVKEKILLSEMHLRTKMASPLDKEHP